MTNSEIAFRMSYRPSIFGASIKSDLLRGAACRGCHDGCQAGVARGRLRVRRLDSRRGRLAAQCHLVLPLLCNRMILLACGAANSGRSRLFSRRAPRRNAAAANICRPTATQYGSFVWNITTIKCYVCPAPRPPKLSDIGLAARSTKRRAFHRPWMAGRKTGQRRRVA
jgi:hypothetical protein